MPNKMERFTHRARRALTGAQQEAERLGHRTIDTPHLLLALIQEDGGVAGRALAELHVRYDPAREIVVELFGDEQLKPGTLLELSADTKHALELGVSEARRLGHDFIGTEHILLGILQLSECSAAKVLVRLNIELDEVQKRVTRILRQEERSVLRPGSNIVSSLIGRRFTPIMPNPVAATPVSGEAMKIIEMMRDKEITAEEAERLLKALPPVGFPTPGTAPSINLDFLVPEDDERQLRVVITDKDTGETDFYISLPLSGAKEGLIQAFNAITNGLVGNFLTVDNDNYQISLYIDKPADDEASV